MDWCKFSYKLLKLTFILSILIIICLFISLFYPALDSDEAFSMSLIHHGYLTMLHLSYFDVHPPLYYLVLKTFLICTTFWTKSIVIKILFAKLLSIIFFVITFITLHVILCKLNINVPIIIQLLVYMIITPTTTLSMQIRMYEMALMFLSLELYYLIKFNRSNKKSSLLIATIMASLASYTHYFAAMFAGSLLLIYMLRNVKNHKKYLKFIYSISSFIIMFIPCSHIALRQIIYVSSSKYSNIMQMPKLNKNILVEILGALSGINFHSFMALILGIIINIILILLTLYYFPKINQTSKKLLLNIFYTCIMSLIIPLILSLVGKPIIQGRYFYPIVSIYEFVLLSIILSKFIKNSHLNLKMGLYYIVICSLLIFSLGNLFKAKSQYQLTDMPNLNVYKESSNENFNKQIILNGDKTPVPLYSVYIENKNFRYKPIIKENSNNVRNTLGSNNKKLLSSTFNDINIQYIK